MKNALYLLAALTLSSGCSDDGKGLETVTGTASASDEVRNSAGIDSYEFTVAQSTGANVTIKDVSGSVLGTVVIRPSGAKLIAEIQTQGSETARVTLSSYLDGNENYHPRFHLEVGDAAWGVEGTVDINGKIVGSVMYSGKETAHDLILIEAGIDVATDEEAEQWMEYVSIEPISSNSSVPLLLGTISDTVLATAIGKAIAEIDTSTSKQGFGVNRQPLSSTCEVSMGAVGVVGTGLAGLCWKAFESTGGFNILVAVPCAGAAITVAAEALVVYLCYFEARKSENDCQGICEPWHSVALSADESECICECVPDKCDAWCKQNAGDRIFIESNGCISPLSPDVNVCGCRYEDNDIDTSLPADTPLTHPPMIDCVGGKYDPDSNLCWQETPNENDLIWEEAKAYCSRFGEEWHLPTVSELRSLFRRGNDEDCYRLEWNMKWAEDPADYCGVHDRCLRFDCYDDNKCNPIGCDPRQGPGTEGCYWDSALSGTCDDVFWSSSEVTDKKMRAWYFAFGRGYVELSSKLMGNSARCVRSGK